MEDAGIRAFDWQRILMDQYPAAFLLEILFRALVVFVVVLASLRITGKRGLKQLSLFELVFILTLGSAGGDVIFYEDVPVIPVVTTFAGIIGFYLLTVYLISRNDRIEKWMEGEPLCIIDDGHFVVKYIERENFSPEEICMELRKKSVEHLGQVKTAVLETSGDLSVFYYADEDVHYGMPTLPAMRKLLAETEDGIFYACARCGNTERSRGKQRYECGRCRHTSCMKALSGKRRA